MAIAFGGAGASTLDYGNVTSRTKSVTTTAGDTILIVFTTTTNSGAITGITFNGSAMTQFGTEQFSGNLYTTVWYMANAPATTADIVMSVGSSQICQFEYLWYTGAEHQSPNGITEGANTGTGTVALNVSVTPVEANSFVVLAVRREQRNSVAGASTNNRTNLSDGSNIFDSTSNPVSVATTINTTTSDATGQRYTYHGFALAPYVAPAGPANLKSLNTNLKANIKSYNSNLIANIKSIDSNV